LCTELKADKIPFIPKAIVLLLEIGNCLVEVITRKKFELSKEVGKKFSAGGC